MRSFLAPLLHWKQRRGFATPLAHRVRDTWRLRDGTAVTLRPAETGDGALIQELVRGLSLTSRQQRFFYPLRELPPDMLARFTRNAPTEAITLLAVIWQRKQEVAVAMVQYVADRYPACGDFAVVVADNWQRLGLGKRLMQALVCVAHAAGIQQLEGDVLAENEAMMQLMSSLGFRAMPHEGGAYLRKVWKTLAAPEWKCSPLMAPAGQFA